MQQSRDLPGQYVLMYYADRNCRKVKGSIDLDHCEQVDIGLKLEVKKIKFDYMFDIKTPSRTYYLAAETKHEMNTWVKYICSVCGLKATNDEEEGTLRVDNVYYYEDTYIFYHLFQLIYCKRLLRLDKIIMKCL